MRRRPENDQGCGVVSSSTGVGVTSHGDALATTVGVKKGTVAVNVALAVGVGVRVRRTFLSVGVGDGVTV
jgi:hypothetical protein